MTVTPQPENQVVEPLTDRERAMLVFAGKPYAHRGTQENDIRLTFACSPIRFWQQIAVLIDLDAAQREFPILCHRLQDRRRG